MKDQQHVINLECELLRAGNAARLAEGNCNAFMFSANAATSIGARDKALTQRLYWLRELDAERSRMCDIKAQIARATVAA